MLFAGERLAFFLPASWLLAALRWSMGALLLGLYFSLAPFGYAAFTLLQCWPARDRQARARLLQRLVQRAFLGMHALLRWLRILDFDARRTLGRLPARPCVLVANHPTLIDVSVVVASLDAVACAVKPQLFRRFWLRPLLVQAAHFAGSDASFASLQRCLDSALERLAQGYHVLVFAEGTRSPRHGLHPFSRSAFEMAVRAGVPVVPLVITCQPLWLAKGERLLPPPAQTPRLQLSVLPALQPSQCGYSSRRLRDAVYTAIRQQLPNPQTDDRLPLARRAH